MELREIKARDGYYLTQSNEVEYGRVFVTALKGYNVNPADWREATEEEKQEYENTIEYGNEES